jgi:hypothetical protein
MNQNLGPEWISVETRLPQPGQRIQGVQPCCVWEELFDPAQPLDRMTHWRPLTNDFEYGDDIDED